MAGEDMGGVEATVRMDTAGLESGEARVKAVLDRTSQHFLALQKNIGKVEAQAKTFDTSMNGIARGSGNASMKLMLLAQTVDDVQYGFRSIVNNIPQVAMAFGAGAGLAGGISIAAVAVNQLMVNWDSLARAFVAAPVETEAEQMERLGKATHNTAEQTRALAAATRERAAAEALVARQPPAVTASIAAIGDAIAAMGETLETGGAKLMESIVQDMLEQGLGGPEGPGPLNKELKRKLEEQRRITTEVGSTGMFDPGRAVEIARKRTELQAEIFAIQERIRADLRAKALQEIGAMGKDPTAMIARAKAKPDVYGYALPGWLHWASPEERARRATEAGARAGTLPGDAAAAGFKARRDADEARTLQAEQDANVARYDEAVRIKRMLGQDPKQRVAAQIAEGHRMDDYADRMKVLGRRLGAAMAPEARSSQVMNMADLNRSVQSSITNEDKALHVQEEIRDINREIRETVRNFNKPFKVGGG